MKKTKLRGITDKQLVAGFAHQDQRIMVMLHRALKQRSYNRVLGALVGLLYVLAALHVAYFYFAGYYAWVGDFSRATLGKLF